MINPIKAIKVFFTLNTAYKQIAKEAKTMNGKTPGYKTTEFWMQIASQAGVVWSAVAGFIPPKYAVIATVGGTAIYTIARTAYKAFLEIKMATSSPSTQVDAQTVVVNK